jgi:hypothetical protein
MFGKHETRVQVKKRKTDRVNVPHCSKAERRGPNVYPFATTSTPWQRVSSPLDQRMIEQVLEGACHPIPSKPA